MTARTGWARPLLSLAALAVVVAVAMALLTPSASERNRGPGPTPDPGPTALSAAEEYAYAALRIMGERAFFVDEATWWPGVVGEAMAAARGARSPAETYGALTTALNAAAGPQGQLLPPGAVPSAEIPALPTVSVGAAIGRITVPSVGPITPKGASARATALADTLGIYSSSATCGWVIDLRVTRSQEDWGLLAGLSAFIQEGPIFDLEDRYGRAFHASAATGSVFLDGRPMASSGHTNARNTKPVAVLQSSETSGAGEALALALRHSNSVRSFGTATRGLPFTQEFGLSDGARLVLPTVRLTDRAGNGYARGVPATVGTDDPERLAHEWLRSQCRQR